MNQLTKYAGATPLIVAEVERDIHGRRVATKPGFCPRPLSRKKLRSMMYRNRQNLTSQALATRYRRLPGYGRTRRILDRQLEEIEAAARKEGAQKLDHVARTMLTRLREIFAPHRRPQRPTRGA